MTTPVPPPLPKQNASENWPPPLWYQLLHPFKTIAEGWRRSAPTAKEKIRKKREVRAAEKAAQVGTHWWDRHLAMEMTDKQRASTKLLLIRSFRCLRKEGQDVVMSRMFCQARVSPDGLIDGSTPEAWLLARKH